MPVLLPAPRRVTRGRRPAAAASASSCSRSALATLRTAPARRVRARSATCPRPRRRPVNVGTDCGVFVRKTLARCSSGRIRVRRQWTSSVASQVGRKRGGAGVSASGSGSARQVDEQPPVSVAEAAQLHALERRRSRSPAAGRPSWRCRRARPGRSPGGSAGPAARARRPASPRPAEPVLGRRVDVGAAALPGAGGRHAHQVEPHADAVEGAGVQSTRSAPRARAGRPRARASPSRAPARSSAADISGARAASARAARRAPRARTASSRPRRRGGSSRASASPAPPSDARARA